MRSVTLCAVSLVRPTCSIDVFDRPHVFHPSTESIARGTVAALAQDAASAGKHRDRLTADRVAALSKCLPYHWCFSARFYLTLPTDDFNLLVDGDASELGGEDVRRLSGPPPISRRALREMMVLLDLTASSPFRAYALVYSPPIGTDGAAVMEWLTGAPPGSVSPDTPRRLACLVALMASGKELAREERRRREEELAREERRRQEEERPHRKQKELSDVNSQLQDCALNREKLQGMLAAAELNSSNLNAKVLEELRKSIAEIQTKEEDLQTRRDILVLWLAPETTMVAGSPSAPSPPSHGPAIKPSHPSRPSGKPSESREGEPQGVNYDSELSVLSLVASRLRGGQRDPPIEEVLGPIEAAIQELLGVPAAPSART